MQSKRIIMVIYSQNSQWNPGVCSQLEQIWSEFWLTDSLYIDHWDSDQNHVCKLRHSYSLVFLIIAEFDIYASSSSSSSSAPIFTFFLHHSHFFPRFPPHWEFSFSFSPPTKHSTILSFSTVSLLFLLFILPLPPSLPPSPSDSLSSHPGGLRCLV